VDRSYTRDCILILNWIGSPSSALPIYGGNLESAISGGKVYVVFNYGIRIWRYRWQGICVPYTLSCSVGRRW